MNIFGKLYLILWIALIAVEIVGATTGYKVTDTMSEYVWAFEAKFPILAPTLISVGMFVLWAHLVWFKGKIQ